MSETNINSSNNIISFSHKSELSDAFFNLVYDYDKTSKNKSTNEITASMLNEITSALSMYCDPESDTQENSSFTINSDDMIIDDLILSVNKNCPEDNKILYYDADNTLHLNINVDNYASLSYLIPILENETFYAYSAEYNKDITREEYKELLSYTVSENISKALDKSLITVSIKDQNGERTKTFSIMDFMLLHTPITL